MDIMRCAHPAELLSAAIDAAGCLPRDSLMLLVMRGSVMNAIMRVDLPPGQLASDELANWARSVTGLLAGFREADGIAVITCSDVPYGRGAGPPGRAAAAALADIAGRAGLRCVLALGIARDGWGMHGTGGRRAAGPWPRDELSGIAREGGFRDLTAVRSEAFADEQLAASIERMRAGGECSFASWRDALDRMSGEVSPRPEVGAGCGLDRVSGEAMARAGSLGRASPGKLPDPAAAAGGAAALNLLASGRMPELLADAVFASGEHAPSWSQALDWALGGHRPGPVRWLPERVGAAIALLTRVHAACEGRDRWRVALCLAWLEWARGRGSAAAGWARRCPAQPGSEGKEDREAGLLLLLASSPLIAPWVREGLVATGAGWIPYSCRLEGSGGLMYPGR